MDQPSERDVSDDSTLRAASEWRDRGFVARRHLVELARELVNVGDDDEHSAFRRVLRAFNGNDLALSRIEELSAAGERDAVEMRQLLAEADVNVSPPWKRTSPQEYHLTARHPGH